MLTRPGRRAAFLMSLIASVLLAGACTDDKASPAASPTPTSGRAPAPAGAEPGTLTGEELRWLQAAEQLLPTMNKAFDDFPAYINTSAELPAALRTLASQARGCSRELARLGVPTARIQPVESLVRKACRQFDKAAKCLDDAAHLGTATSPSQVHQRERLVACGFAAADAGRTPLAQAQITVAEIRVNATATP